MGRDGTRSEKESKASKKFLEGKVQHWGRRNVIKTPIFTSTTPWLLAPSYPGLKPIKATLPACLEGRRGQEGGTLEVGLAKALTDGELTTFES